MFGSPFDVLSENPIVTDSVNAISSCSSFSSWFNIKTFYHEEHEERLV